MECNINFSNPKVSEFIKNEYNICHFICGIDSISEIDNIARKNGNIVMVKDLHADYIFIDDEWYLLNSKIEVDNIHKLVTILNPSNYTKCHIKSSDKNYVYFDGNWIIDYMPIGDLYDYNSKYNIDCKVGEE